MKKQLRSLALFTCITAASAAGAQIASADTTAPTKGRAAKCGEQYRHHGERGRHHFLQKLAKQLGLSEQQKGQAQSILQASRAQNKPYFQALMTERHQMKELMLSGTADEAAIRAQSAKVAAAQADLAVQRNNEAKQLLALLTPDQKTKLKTIVEKREQKFKRFRDGDEHFRHGDDPAMP